MKHIEKRQTGSARAIIQRRLPATARDALEYLLAPREENLVFALMNRPGIGQPGRLMLDVGAHTGSTAQRFAKHQWTVHAFEPDAEHRAQLERRFAGLANVVVDKRAVADVESEAVPFYTSALSPGISSLSAFHESHERAGTVATTTVAAYCATHAIESIDFIKIDTEGHDFQVLQGVPWGRIKPTAIVCEFEDRKTQGLGYDFHRLAAYIRDFGYGVLVSEWHPVVQYGGKHRWRKFKVYPCELETSEAWGNVICVQGHERFQKLVRIAQLAVPRWKLGNLMRKL